MIYLSAVNIHFSAWLYITENSVFSSTFQFNMYVYIIYFQNNLKDILCDNTLRLGQNGWCLEGIFKCNGSDNGLLPVWCQAITWISDGIVYWCIFVHLSLDKLNNIESSGCAHLLQSLLGNPCFCTQLPKYGGIAENMLVVCCWYSWL